MSQGERDLQVKYKTKRRADAFYNNQMIDYLNDEMKQFVKEQSFIFISTRDKHGNCDSSFKAGEPGFLQIIDDKHLIYPEYRGNGVMASLGNIVENPHIGLLLLDFFNDQIGRSEEHTSELQSRFDLVCRLLLEKKKQLHRCLSSFQYTAL